MKIEREEFKAAYAWIDNQRVEYRPAQKLEAVETEVKPARFVVRKARRIGISRQNRAPQIQTTRADERAILRAVYALGLIKEGDIL
jgi:hypothetical protein